MRPIDLPDPCLVVLVGPAGSGKSTLAARHFGPDEVFSSDAYRKSVSGDEADQRATGVAFRRLHAALSTRLALRRLSVVDATNVTPQARRALLVRARAAGIPAVAVVLDLPRAVVQARNAGRMTRVVDALVVDRHLTTLRDAIDAGAFTSEGFALVVVLDGPAAVDALRFERRPR